MTTPNKSTDRKKDKKPKRVILGVGHPWFHTTFGPTCKAVGLTSIRNGIPKSLRFGKHGNWNKVRLVMEVLK